MHSDYWVIERKIIYVIVIFSFGVVMILINMQTLEVCMKIHVKEQQGMPCVSDNRVIINIYILSVISTDFK